MIIGVVVPQCLMIANHWERMVVLRLGRLRGIRGPGLFFIIPFVDTVATSIDQRIQTAAFNAEKFHGADHRRGAWCRIRHAGRGVDRFGINDGFMKDLSQALQLGDAVPFLSDPQDDSRQVLEDLQGIGGTRASGTNAAIAPRSSGFIDLHTSTLGALSAGFRRP